MPEPTAVMPAPSYRRVKTPAWWLVGVAILLAAAGSLVWYVTRGTGDQDPPAAATATTVPVTTLPSTIDDAIAALRADPERYGQHTATIIEGLERIQQGDDVAARAAGLLADLESWVAAGEVPPETLTMLQPLLTPLIQAAEDELDSGGNSNANGNGNGGNGNGNGNGNGGNGNGNGNGKGRRK